NAERCPTSTTTVWAAGSARAGTSVGSPPSAGRVRTKGRTSSTALTADGWATEYATELGNVRVTGAAGCRPPSSRSSIPVPTAPATAPAPPVGGGPTTRACSVVPGGATVAGASTATPP